MGKVSKATKKFTKKHLKSAIRQRKAVQKIKRGKQQQEAARASKPTRVAQDPRFDDEEQPKKALEDMSIDEFMAGGFLDAPAEDDADLLSVDDGTDSDGDLASDLVSSDEDEQPAAAQAEGRRPPNQQQAAAGRKRKQAGKEAPDSEDESSESEDEGKSRRKDRSEKSAASSKATLKEEMASHKAQLDALKEQDPEFYAYLQSTDQELLNFGQDSEDELDSEAEEEDASDDEEGLQDDAQGATRLQPQPSGITLAMVDGWCQAAQDKASMGAVRNIMKAYRAACHYGDSEEQVEESMRIASSAVYNKLMLFVLREIDGIFRRMLLEGASAKQQQQPLSASLLVKLPRWKKVDPLVKSYLGNTLHLLGALTDGAMLTFIMRRLRASTVLLAPYEKLQRRLLKAALGLFGSADNTARVQAILLVRQMALELPHPALDNCLKGVYRAFSTNAKFVNAATVPQINFMAAAVVEMYGIHAAASYQHAFNFIRQLAVLLRSALTSKSKEAYREVYNWQTINCLELWAKLLAAKADEPELRPLIYPVTQLLLGVARLVPSPAYFPLRLRCARALNRLGEATNTFIPVAPILLEVLQWSDLRKAPKPGGGQQDVLLQLRATKASMRSAQYQEDIITQVMELLADHLACWGCHIAFPELAFIPLSHLRNFVKHTPVERFKKAAKQLVEVIEKNVTFVGRARDQVDFSPKDLAQVAKFMEKESAAKQAPIQQYARTLVERARQRLQMRLADTVDLGSTPAAVADDSDDDELPSGNLLPEKKKQEKAAATQAEPAAKRQKRAAEAHHQQGGNPSQAAPGDVEGEEGEGVELLPYELSDEDDSEGGNRKQLGASAFVEEGESDDDASSEEEQPKEQQLQRAQRTFNKKDRGSKGRGGKGSGGKGRGGRGHDRGVHGTGRDGGGGGKGRGAGKHSSRKARNA